MHGKGRAEDYWATTMNCTVKAKICRVVLRYGKVLCRKV